MRPDPGFLVYDPGVTPRTLRTYYKPLTQWGTDHGIDINRILLEDLSGAYVGYNKELGVIEFCMHELGHYMASGGVFADLPTDLFDWVGHHADGLSRETADSWERDAAAITYLAGHKLRFWRDAQPIALSCLKNHQRVMPVTEFDDLLDKAMKDSTNIRKADEMATYLRLIRRNYIPQEKNT